jgi:hypothetical protein
MQKASFSVKYRLGLVCVIGLLCSFASAWQARKPDVEKSLTPEFESHADYLAQSLRSSPFETLRKELEKELRSPLKNRGEAHLTVITPPEWKILEQKISMAEAEKIAMNQKIQAASFEPLCIGVGEKKAGEKTLKTYFVVVRSPGLLKYRRTLEDLFRSRGGAGAFRADHFFPHVTLGFTDRDLHESDGVVKDEKSCLFRWSSP